MSVVQECLEKSRVDALVLKIDLFLERNVDKIFTEHYDQLVSARTQLLYYIDQEVLKDESGLFHFGSCNFLRNQQNLRKGLCCCFAIELCELTAVSLMEHYEKLFQRMNRKKLILV